MPIVTGQDTAKTRKTLSVAGQTVAYYSIPAAEAAGLGQFSRLPAALKVVLENMLRFEDGGRRVPVDALKAFSDGGKAGGKNPREIAYRPARVLMQDFTGVPAVVDLAAMRDGIKALGGDPQKINPLNPVIGDRSFGEDKIQVSSHAIAYMKGLQAAGVLTYGQLAALPVEMVAAIVGARPEEVMEDKILQQAASLTTLR